MAMGIDRQIQARMALGQDRLQQEYAQTQQLIDLLALQKLSKEKAEAARAVQASMQTNPATVKDQLEQQLTAQSRQGIASMMPGIQMQGQRMAQAQARQAAGIPSQPAPNMARMAGGGIVAFQEGGMPRSDAESIAYDMIAIERQMGRPDKTEEELRQLDTRRMELNARMANDPTGNLRADVYKNMDVIKAGGADRLQLNNTIQQVPAGGFTAKLINYILDDRRKKKAKEKEDAFVGPTEDMVNGMYDGGVVGYAPGGYMSDVEREVRARLQQELGRQPRVQEIQDAVANEKLKRELENKSSQWWAERNRSNIASEASATPDRMSDPEIMDMYARERRLQQSERDANIARQSLQREYEEGAGNASTVMGQQSNQSDIDRIISDMGLLVDSESRPTTSSEIDELINPLTERTKTILAPGYAESQRSARELAAKDAYAVPEELKQLYRNRQTELEGLKRSPEDIRRRELAALLGGIASSPYIARSGTQAYRGMEQVREQARQENIATAQKSFDMSKELVGLDRDASVKAFDAGLTALSEANAAEITALQTVNNMIQGVQNRELQRTLANQGNQLALLQAKFQNELKKIDVAAGIDRDRQATLRTVYTNATDFYDNVVTSKAEQSVLFGDDPEIMQRINTIYDALITGAANTIDSISQLLDVGGTIPSITRPATSGASSAVSAADAILGIE